MTPTVPDKPSLEGLEDRSLLAIFVSKGVLYITGTNRHDRAVVSQVERAGKCKYKVTLKFSENQETAKGKRTFDVSVQGTKLATKVDLFDKAQDGAMPS